MEVSPNQNIPLDLVFNILPVLVAFFYIFRFLTIQKTYKSSHYYLAFLFGLIVLVEGFAIGVDYLSGATAYYMIPVFLGASLSFAPTIYLFVKNLAGEKQKLEHSIKVFYPAIFLSLFDLLLFFLINTIKKDTTAFEVVYLLVWIVTLGSLIVVFIIQNFILLIRSFRILKDYESKLGELYSFEEGVSLKWLQIFIYGYLLFFIALVITSLPGFDNYFKYSFDLVVLVFLIYTGSNAVRQYNILDTINAIRIDVSETTEENLALAEQESNQGVQDRFKEIKKNLEEVMSVDKPFLNSKLTIYDLAKKVSTNYKYLSRVINEEYDMNFANFINSYRVEEAKEKLLDRKTRNYKIEVIAEMVGFNSKSAYNTAFKKFTGKTPSEFRDER